MNREEQADLVIIGGGTGGCAAAMAACRLGLQVIMTEETEWIGGQLTSQAVPPDEHPWIEQFGCTSTYRQFRNGVRDYYKSHYPLSNKAHSAMYLNPGNGHVSRLCHEPRVALAVLNSQLSPYVNSGKLRIMTHTRPISAEVEGDDVRAVTVQHTGTHNKLTLIAPMFIDATEIGELLPLTKTEYVTGAESQSVTGEPRALQGDSQPLDMQAISHCFALEYDEFEDHTITKPEGYEFWRTYKADFWPDNHFSFVTPIPWTLEANHQQLFPSANRADSLWQFRRIIDKANFQEGTYNSDITLVNWPQIDYWLGPVFEVEPDVAAEHLRQARNLSLSFLYWMQTEAIRPDGKQGYAGLKLAPHVTGTDDGLAMAPYIRESRRIQAEFTVLEQHVSPEGRHDGKAAEFFDSVGVGSYRIDLHPSTALRNYVDVSALPFQIPLGSLLPVRVNNLIPACKNIGTTHITNGCYRLHPVEWNIGEAAGALAAYTLKHKLQPRQVRSDKHIQDFQKVLRELGLELEWPVLRAL
ncbi:FAD-dependent oxidoreductase [Paenibacillus sp. strain BS8-2]